VVAAPPDRGDAWLLHDVVVPDPARASELSEPVDVLLAEGRIASIRPVQPPAPTDHAQRLDGQGKLLLPGLVNAHFHSTGTFNRSCVENLPLELFMLYELPPFDFGPFPPDLYRTQALLAARDMLRVGVTSVMDDAMFYPEPTADTLDGLMSAYRDAGIRATVGVYQPNRVEYEWIPGLKERLAADVVARMDAIGAPSTEQIMEATTGFVDRWHGAAQGRLRCAVSCAAPQRATDAYLVSLHQLATQRGIPMVMHVYETKLQRFTAASVYGTSMIRHLRGLGVLDQQAVVVHAVWVDDDDIGDLAATGAVVVHSPAGNLRCGSGVMPYRRLVAAGVPVALCTDEATVEDNSNLWQVARLAGMLHTIADPDYDTWPRASELLAAATTGGAHAFGLAGELGVTREGGLADVILLDLDRIGRAPPRSLANALVYGEDGSSVREVFVAGRLVVQAGQVLTIDAAALSRDEARHREAWAQARGSVDQWAERLAPVYADLYERCSRADAGINRWAGDPETWFAQRQRHRPARTGGA
jgi:5-methylthioadenosine/S-adenosylhomocysteine deaminase